MALTKEEWERSVALVPPAPEPVNPTPGTLAWRIRVIEEMSHLDCENVLVVIARDHPEIFDHARFSAL